MDLASAFPTTIEIFERPVLGEVVKSISLSERGRVKFRGTYWFARFDSSPFKGKVSPGDPILVVGREGLTLLVTTLR